MDLHINRLMNHSTQLLKERFGPSESSLQTKVLIVALIALSCLAAYLYYAMNAQPQAPKSAQKITPPAPLAPPAGKGKPLDKQKQASDLDLHSDHVLVPHDDDDSKAMQDDQKSAAQIKKSAAPIHKPHAKPAAVKKDEDADFQKALLLSLQDAQLPDDEDSAIEAALKESAKDIIFQDDEAALKAALKESKAEAEMEAGELIITDDDDFAELLRKTEEEAKEKEELEFKKALQLSQKDAGKFPAILSAALKPPSGKPSPKPPAGATPKPGAAAPTPVPDPAAKSALAATPKGPIPPPPPPPKPADPAFPAAIDAKADAAPMAKPIAAPSPGPATPVATPKLKGTPMDKGLLETANAKSDVCEDSLNLAVDKAKENKKIRILKHEVKRNDVHNAYLVLHFQSEVSRNLAVEELRSKYSMFSKTKEPARIDETILEFNVEQTIEFQNAF